MCIRKMDAFVSKLCLFVYVFTGRSNCANVLQTSSLFVNKTQNVTIQCSHDDSSLRVMLWYQQKIDSKMALIGYIYATNDPSYEDEFKGRFKQSKESTTKGKLTIINVLESDSAVYYCAAREGDTQPAHFGQGTKLTVLDNSIKITEPKRVSLLNVSENEVCTKTNVTLVCVAEGFYPDHVSVSWSVDGEKRETDVSTDEAAIQDVKTNFYSISSRLNINYKDEWTKGKEFTCTVSFFNGTVYTEHSDSYRSPKNLGENLVEKYIQSANVTMLAYGMFIGKSIAYGLFILYVIKRQGFISK